MAVTSVETFVQEFARALERRDDRGCAQLWGRGAVVLADRFEAVADAPDQLRPLLTGAWPVYDFLDLARIEHRVLEEVELTERITRVLVRYSFFDGAGEHLVDGDFEYVLRREGEVVACHIGVNISAEPNLADLARRRGFRPEA